MSFVCMNPWKPASKHTEEGRTLKRICVNCLQRVALFYVFQLRKCLPKFLLTKIKDNSLLLPLTII